MQELAVNTQEHILVSKNFYNSYSGYSESEQSESESGDSESTVTARAQ